LDLLTTLFGGMDFSIPSTELPIIFSIIILDGILSVDNAMVNAAIAKDLPPRQQRFAIIFGLAAGAVLRVVALLAVGLILKFPELKLLGALYLGYLCVNHFFLKKEEHGSQKPSKARFRDAVIAIGLADIAFSVDNVVASVGMSQYISVVIIGVLSSVIVMMFATQIVLVLLKRYPSLEHAAFALIGLIAVSIVVEDLHALMAKYHLGEFPEFEVPSLVKFGTTIAIVLGVVIYEEVKRADEKRKAIVGS
jgi:YkoY family integral membrane protein